MSTREKNAMHSAADSVNRLSLAFESLHQEAKRRYTDLDELVAVARRVDPDVGWLDVVAYLDGGAPTHFSEAIDACGLPVHKRLRRSGQ